MRYLYVENFRGFEREFIPLENVNFLIGENSTGKSSILALIHLFSSPNFWFQQEFNINEFELGNYEDIISINAQNMKYFRIGLIECPEKITQKEKLNILAFLMEFNEKDGIPVISKYYYINGINAIKIIFSQDTIRYRIDRIDYTDKIVDDVLHVFKAWLNSNNNIEKFKLLKVPSKTYHVPPLLFITNLIEGETKIEAKNKKLSFVLRLPSFATNFVWLAPIRSKPKRTYDQFKYTFSPEGEHAPYLVMKYLKDRESKQSLAFKNFMHSYGKESGLLNDISISKLGTHEPARFELKVSLALEEKPLNISNVGYGVSQSLPILVELFTRPKNTWFAIQQPEVHLHPRAQAAFGDIFYQIALNDDKHFFIETHSDYIIDRFRINVRDNNKTIHSQVLFFERINGINKVYSISILPNGKFSDNQPESFRDFFIKEELLALGIK